MHRFVAAGLDPHNNDNLACMNIDTSSGLIENGRFVPSPNHDPRPDGEVPGLIVMHGISLPPGEFGDTFVDDFFQNKLDVSLHPYFAEIDHLRVSAHAMINRRGSITQYVPFHLRAWHAGESEFDGRAACNDFSVGIELEGTDVLPYRTMQYWSAAELIVSLKQAYPSLRDCPIVGHSDIAPGRKTDPGPGFDWHRLTRLIGKIEEDLNYA